MRASASPRSGRFLWVAGISLFFLRARAKPSSSTQYTRIFDFTNIRSPRVWPHFIAHFKFLHLAFANQALIAWHGRVTCPSEVRTCRFWRPQGRDNSQGGTQKHRILLCTSDSWEAGSQACGAPRSLLLRAPITAPTRIPTYARARARARPFTYDPVVGQRARWCAPLNLPANSHTCTYIGQTTQRKLAPLPEFK